jgi:hypothetical protein
MLVDAPCQHLLSRPGFSYNQHRSRVLSDLLSQAEDSTENFAAHNMAGHSARILQQVIHSSSLTARPTIGSTGTSVQPNDDLRWFNKQLMTWISLIT